MNKLIIAVKSCQRDLERGDHVAIRRTWGADAKAAGIDVRFFVGSKNLSQIPFRPLGDEVGLDCDDTYKGLPFKTRAICQWARGKLLSHIFLCDTDTYVYVKYLLTSGFEKYDFMGQMLHPLNKPFPYRTIDLDGAPEVHDPCYTWASGGLGYFLSRRAAVDVSESFPNSWAEDLYVGQVMGPNLMYKGWTAKDVGGNTYTGNMYSWHFPQNSTIGGKYDPKYGWMDEMQQKDKG